MTDITDARSCGECDYYESGRCSNVLSEFYEMQMDASEKCVEWEGEG